MTYLLTLNGEVVHAGNKKNNDRKFREYKKKGIKVQKHLTSRAVVIGELY